MPDVPIINRATVTAPKDYTLPQSQEILLKAVRAEFDGTSAASAFLPALQLVSNNGDVMWTAVLPSTTVAAGGSASVNWFPLKRLVSAAVTPPNNPLGTLYAWYDFSDTSTISLDGSGNIAQITDKSGNGHTLGNPTAANRPGQTTINALNAGLFNSTTGTWLSGGGFNPTLPSPYTVFVVNTLTRAAGANYDPGAVGGDQLGNQVLIQTDTSSRPFLQLQSSSIVFAAQPQPHTQYMFVAIVDGVSSAMRVNGAQQNGNLNVADLNNIGLGQAHIPLILPDDSGLDGAIGEVLYYQTHLSVSQISGVETYLRAKWNTP